MIGSCSGMSFLCTPRYVSWCADSAESPTPAAAAALTAAEGYCHQDQRLAGPGSIPLLLLSPPETHGGEAKATFSHRHPRPTLTNRKHHDASTCPCHSGSNPHFTNSHSDECEGDDGREEGSKGNLRRPEADIQSGGEPSLLHPEDENFHLPRSSPVISKGHRPRSWHGGGTDTSNTSSSDSSSPGSGSPFPDQRGCLTAASMEDLGYKPSSFQRSFPVRADEKPRCSSVSSHVNRLLSGLTGHYSGQQGPAEERRGRGLSRCDVPHATGFSTSTHHSKDRRCSNLPDFSADIFKSSCELEKENAHFIVVDMVLEVLEGAKWTLGTSATDARRRARCDTCTQRRASSERDGPPLERTREAHGRARDGGAADPERETHGRGRSDEDAETALRDTRSSFARRHTRGKDEEETMRDEDKHPTKTLSVLSTDSGFEDFGVDATLTPRDSLRNAEWLAQQLVLDFRRSWLPSREPRRGRQSLRSSLQELPGTGGVAVNSGSLTEEIRLRTRMRGSLNWAPPRFQIIFTVQPTHRRSEVLAFQHFLCAGCGTEVEPRYIKKLRYCEYLGRYFCDCCHSSSEAVIPGRVLSCWDFGRYSVSDFSRQLLDSVWCQPLFDLSSVGKTLYSRVKELDKFRELQEQLLGIKKLLTACRLSKRVVAEFEQLPAHLTEQPHLFSMDDLWKVKKGQLVAQARAVLHTATEHVDKCELCLARGFICEFCREQDVIFPFQSDICKRCTACKACFHKHCFMERKCPKCARIQSRKKHPDGSRRSDVRGAAAV